jgi:anti-anti-sigma factor
MNYKLKIIQPRGIFDGRKGRQIYEELSKIVGSGIQTVILDFQDITFMDSAGFGTILLTLKTVRQEQIRLVLCSINEQVRMILEISDTIKFFEVFPDQESFLQTVNDY